MGSRIEISGHPSEHPAQNCATVFLHFHKSQGNHRKIVEFAEGFAEFAEEFAEFAEEYAEMTKNSKSKKNRIFVF